MVKTSEKPLINIDPGKALKRALGVEEATPQEMQAETPKPEPSKVEAPPQPTPVLGSPKASMPHGGTTPRGRTTGLHGWLEKKK